MLKFNTLILINVPSIHYITMYNHKCIVYPFISSFNYYTFYIIYKPKSIIINKLILPLGQIFKQYAVYHINLHSLNFIIMTKLSSN